MLRQIQFEDLAEDIYFQVFSFLSFTEQQKAIVCRGLFNVANNENTLLETFKTQFGPTPFPKDIKLQMKAAHLLRWGVEAKDPAKAQQHYSDLREFLDKHKQPWVNYYFGMMHFYGLGVTENEQTGLYFFHRALLWNDFRAATRIIKMLFEYRADQNKFSSIITFLMPEGINSLVINLKRCHPNSRYLGMLYHLGIGVHANPAEAEKYFLHAFKKYEDTSAALDLTSIYMQNPAENLIKTKKFLKKCFKQIPSHQFAMEIADLYFQYDRNFDKSRKWYKHAYQQGAKGAAIQKIALCYKAQTQFEKAKQFFALAFQQGVTSVARELGDYIQAQEIPGTQQEMIEWYKKGYFAGDKEALFCLADFYLEGNWFHHPNQIWWLLTAAANGSQDAIAIAAGSTHFENVKIALAVLEKLEILDEEGPIPLPVPSDFSVAAIDEFKAVGQQEKLLDAPIDTILTQLRESMVNKSIPRLL